MAVDNIARALAAKAIAGSGAGSSSGSSGSGVQVQADCNIVDETNPAFIKNKPWEMGYQTVFTQDALDNYAQVAPNPTGKFVPGIETDIQIDSVPIVKDKTYYVKCSSDQGIVEYTGKAIEVQDGSIALGDADFSSDNPITETTSIVIMMNAEFGAAMIMILFNNLASANESDVPTLTNVSLTIQEPVVTKKISSDYIDLPENNQIQADWSTTVETDPSFIKNKPNIVQSDWNTTDSTLPSFIKNKPNITTPYMIYKSKYENGDYLGKEMYEAVRNGSTVYYVDDTNATPQYGSSNITYYPMTSISIVQTCGLDFNIECTYTSWEYDTSSKTYVCTRNTLNMYFRNT